MSFANATMTISEPYDIYNLGDRLYVTVDGIKGTDVGNFNIDLECENSTINLLKISARAFSSKDSQTYELPYKELTKEDLEINSFDKILGNCQVVASLNDEKATTKSFLITDELTIIPKLDKINYNPGETINLEIEAKKANGENVYGYVELSNATETKIEIADGKTSTTIETSEESPAKTYMINIFVYEKTSLGNILNKGNISVQYKINQIPKEIKIVSEKLETTPGKEFVLGAEIYDQTGEKMDGTLSTVIASPEKKTEITTTLSTKEFLNVNFPLNSTPGTWTIYSYLNGLSDEREIEMLGIQKADFYIENSVLTITNVGNIKYNKTLEFNFGDDKRSIDIELDLGETRKYNLEAPDGKYDVAITDGEESIQKTLLLTGRAISINDITNSSIFKNPIIYWIILIIILAGIFIYFFRKNKNNTKEIRNENFFDKIKNSLGKIKSKFYHVNNNVKIASSKVQEKIPKKYSSEFRDSMNFTNKSPDSQSLDENTLSKEDLSLLDLTKAKIAGAESSLVLKGEKSKASIITIKIDNYNELNENSKNELSKIISTKDEKGVIEIKENYINIIFSPLITKTYANEKISAKVAFRIFEKLKEHNKKFANKIKFNIAVNSGDIIASLEQNKQTNTKKLKYTGIGNTITLVKRIAESKQNELLISESIRNSLMRDLKVEKAGTIGKTNIYSIKGLRTHEADKEKLQELLKRMEN